MNDEKFWDKFWGRVVEQGECLLWNGAAVGSGYGAVKRNKQLHYVHVLVWEEKHGPVPEGMCVAHTCPNRRCVEHLRLTTAPRSQEAREWRDNYEET